MCEYREFVDTIPQLPVCISERTRKKTNSQKRKVPIRFSTLTDILFLLSLDDLFLLGSYSKRAADRDRFFPHYKTHMNSISLDKGRVLQESNLVAYSFKKEAELAFNYSKNSNQSIYLSILTVLQFANAK